MNSQKYLSTQAIEAASGDSSNIRSLHFASGCAPNPRVGGVGTAAANLLGGLASQGHSVDLLIPTVLGSEEHLYPSFVKQIPSGTIAGKDSTVGVVYPRFRSLLSIRAGLIDADLVHIHGGHRSLFSFAGMLLARRAGVPVIWQPHGAAQSIGANVRFKNLWDSSLGRVQKRLISRCVSLTSSEDEQIRTIWPSAPISRVVNCVDDVGMQHSGGPRKPPRKFAFMGRLNWKKGVVPLLHSWNSSGAADHGASLSYFGPDDGQLAELKGGLRRGQNVSLCGAISAAEVAETLSGFDVLVVPSLTDTFPMVILEALQLGLEVVARETIEVFRDQTLLAKATHKFSTDEELTLLLRGLASGDRSCIDPGVKEQAMESFSPAGGAARMLDVYQQVIGGGPETVGGHEHSAIGGKA